MTDYFVDFITGDDIHPGTSVNRCAATLEQVFTGNDVKPGDTITLSRTVRTAALATGATPIRLNKEIGARTVAVVLEVSPFSIIFHGLNSTKNYVGIPPLECILHYCGCSDQYYECLPHMATHLDCWN